MDSHRGFSLVEVLIALLVLALGILGMLALQLQTTRVTRNIATQSLALQLSADIAETVRASAKSVEMMRMFEQFDFAANDALSSTASSTTCLGTDRICSPAQMAASEIHDWRQRLQQLPGGRMRICRDATPWRVSELANRWECDGTAAVNPALIPLWIKVGWRDASANSSMVSSGPSTPQLVLPLAVFAR